MLKGNEHQVPGAETRYEAEAALEHDDIAGGSEKLSSSAASEQIVVVDVFAGEVGIYRTLALAVQKGDRDALTAVVEGVYQHGGVVLGRLEGGWGLEAWMAEARAVRNVAADDRLS